MSKAVAYIVESVGALLLFAAVTLYWIGGFPLIFRVLSAWG